MEAKGGGNEEADDTPLSKGGLAWSLPALQPHQKRIPKRRESTSTYLVTAGDGGLIDTTLCDHFGHLDRQTMNV